MNSLKSIDFETIFYIFIVPSLIIFSCVFGVVNRPKNLSLDAYSLKCKTLSWDQKSNKTSCHSFDLVYVGTQKFLDVNNSKNKKTLSFINNHCISFDKKNNCKSIALNFSSLELKNIYSGAKKIDTDFVGNLSLNR